MKVKQETVFTVDYNDLDKAVSEYFGRKYECVAYEEWNNDESHDFNVDGEIDDFDEKYNMPKLATWISTGKGNPSLRTMLNKMCADGVIQPGKYIVEISW